MYNQKIKLRQNIEAIKIAFGKQEYDIDKLRLFSGWGGIKSILNNPWNNDDWELSNDAIVREDIKELHSLLESIMSEKDYKKSIDSIKAATLTSFYTPDVIVKTFYEVLKQYMYVNNLYDPSSGAGIFFLASQEVININSATLYEKDIVTGKVLQSIVKNSNISVNVQIKPFEESSDEENGKYSLVATNVPFGQIKIYDPKFKDSNIVGKIHNYFVAKSIDKLKEGGILAIIISNFFLDTVSNKTIRRYLFERCDFISLVVMPDNLMADTGGTMAPSHFLVVQKNTNKTELSPEEELLIESSFVENKLKGRYARNNYLQLHSELVIGEMKQGTNQYGKAAIEVHWKKPIIEIATPFSEILHRDFEQRFNYSLKQAEIQNTNDDRNKVSDIPNYLKQYPLTPDECFSKAAEIAIEQNGLSDIFKTKEEHLADLQQNEQEEITLPTYLPFKEGIIIEI